MASHADERSPRSLRVAMLLNGSPPTAVPVVMVISEGSTMEDVLKRATPRLCPDAPADAPPLTRIFCTSGCEVRYLSDLLPGETLYFSHGEPFIGTARPASEARRPSRDAPAAAGAAAAGIPAPPSYSPSMGADASAYVADAGAPDMTGRAGDDIGARAGAGVGVGAGAREPGVLRRLAHAAAGLATTAYAYTSDYLKTQGPDSVREGLPAWEARLAPLLAAAGASAGPALDWADDQLVVARQQLAAKRDEFLASEAGQNLQASLQEAAAASADAAARAAGAGVASAEGFYMTASEVFQDLRSRGSEQGVALAEHLVELKARLGAAWDEKFAPAARGVWEMWRAHQATAAARAEEQREARMYGIAPSGRSGEGRARAGAAGGAGGAGVAGDNDDLDLDLDREAEYAAVAAAALADAGHAPGAARGARDEGDNDDAIGALGLD